ncbi:MAG: hypothetical protein JL50_21705 [Peptococcaceae bacterium BICA1-7]|nr:MAG: hypothetical protein JL50_21705 [Peptococcaceae bacterium BICA1-7]HBV99354.1 hypothetical protein [Desulfotomaculum sp.]
MLDFLKSLIIGLPDFTRRVLLELKGSEYHQRVEYYAAALLFLLLVAFLFLPGTMLKLRRKITIALIFGVSPIMLYIVPVSMAPPDSRLAPAWPYFSLIACIFIILYILEEILIWRFLYKKRKSHYPSWLKPPEKYR